MGIVIELYEDTRSGWRVLTSPDGSTGYRFKIVERVGQATFAGDARELAAGEVPAGLERIDLDREALHGIELVAPCAIWRRGRVERTTRKPGVLTDAYIAGELVARGTRRKRQG